MASDYAMDDDVRSQNFDDVDNFLALEDARKPGEGFEFELLAQHVAIMRRYSIVHFNTPGPLCTSDNLLRAPNSIQQTYSAQQEQDEAPQDARCVWVDPIYWTTIEWPDYGMVSNYINFSHYRGMLMKLQAAIDIEVIIKEAIKSQLFREVKVLTEVLVRLDTPVKCNIQDFLMIPNPNPKIIVIAKTSQTLDSKIHNIPNTIIIRHFSIEPVRFNFTGLRRILEIYAASTTVKCNSQLAIIQVDSDVENLRLYGNLKSNVVLICPRRRRELKIIVRGCIAVRLRISSRDTITTKSFLNPVSKNCAEVNLSKRVKVASMFTIHTHAQLANAQ